MRKDIYLPHINYTVKVRPLKPDPGGKPNTRAWCEHVDDWHSAVYLPKRVVPGLIAHELVHVLRHLCESRNMSFDLEREHMAYIMQYLMDKILGYVWEKS